MKASSATSHAHKSKSHIKVTCNIIYWTSAGIEVHKAILKNIDTYVVTEIFQTNQFNFPMLDMT